MQIISKDELLLNKDLYFNKILQGATIIYPTDTIYALGCSAVHSEAVARVREAKQRPEQPFSVIPPSKDWIVEHCVIDEKAEEWLAKLPGPYTIILKLKDKSCVAENVLPTKDTIGIRIPDHWFADVVAELNIPMITPSANVSGMNFMTGVDDLSSPIKQKTDFMIDDGEINGKPSTLVNLSTGEEEITQRSKLEF